MDIYCSRINIPRLSCRFIYDGETIRDSDTVNSLGINEGDEIDAMVEQHGGGIKYYD